MINKLLYPVFIILSFMCLTGYVNAETFEVVANYNYFEPYSNLSDDDLILLNNFFTEKYGSDEDNIYIVTSLLKEYKFNFDNKNLYFYVFERGTGNISGNTYGKYLFFNFFKSYSYGSYRFSENRYKFNLETKEIVLSTDNLISRNLSDSYTSYQWLSTSDSNAYGLYLPLWISKPFTVSMTYEANFDDISYDSYSLKFDNSVNFEDRVNRHYNIYNYYSGNGSYIRSYIDFALDNSINPPESKDVNYKVNYYFDDVLNEELSYIGNGKVGEKVSLIPDTKFDNYILKNDNNYLITLVEDEEQNVINIYYVTSSIIDVPNKDDYNDIDTNNGNFYFFINYSDLKEMFPGVNFDSFNQFHQFTILIIINMFYLMFWFFVGWVVLKILYKVFQWI